MKIQISKLLISALLILAILPQNTFAAFPDVSQSHKNFTAIEYLQNNNTINGYPDGTFKPDNTINRAEFLKLIIEGSGIPTDVTENSPFPDVDHLAWYGPYVKKAYQQGWIQGYTDGTFRPSQSISKVEALKIIGESQAWQLEDWVADTYFSDVFRSMWFAPYVSFAKQRGYLEDIGPELLPNQEATRGYISEVIYRSTVNGLYEIFEEPETPPVENPDTEVDITDVTDTGNPAIGTNFFEGFVLEEGIPTTLYKNEVFIIKGSVATKTEDEATVILEYSDNNESYTYTEKLNNNNFEIPVHFRESGNYSIGIIQGESGFSNAHSLTVLENLPDPSTSNSPPNISSNSLNFSDDLTYISYNAPDDSIKKVIFSQGSKTVTYLNRQDLEYIPFQYRDFKNFSTGSTNYKMEIANLESSNPLIINSTFNPDTQKSFTALEHTFSAISDDFSATSLPEIVSPGNSFTLSGTLNQDFESDAAIVLPNGTVEFQNITTNADNIVNSNYIRSGSSFSLNYTPPSSGTYIFEINDLGGIAIINHPIYVSNGIPLIPDFFDLNEREFFSGPFNLNTLRQEMLNLINDFREDFGLNPVTLSSDLNDVAQNHTDDMVINNYFAHVNLQGETPDDRRIEAGITTAVGENLARDVSLEFAHYGLIRSAIHRNNLLTPSWEVVGIGITEDNGYLMIAQEFSTNQLTSSDLDQNKAELYEAINDVRIDNGQSTLSSEASLENVGEYLNDLMINDGEEITNQTFNNALDLYEIYGSTEAMLRVHPHWETILESILEDSTILNSLWDSFGADIQLDELGNQYLMLILNKD